MQKTWWVIEEIILVNEVIMDLTDKIKHRLTTSYNSRTNDQTEKTNGILYKIITKTIQGSMSDWDSKLLYALWAYHMTYKVTKKFTPFQLLYSQRSYSTYCIRTTLNMIFSVMWYFMSLL